MPRVDGVARTRGRGGAPIANSPPRASRGRGRRGGLSRGRPSFTLEADERKIRERGETTSAPVARHSWLAKQSSADLESEFRDAAADETTSLLHRPPSRFRDAAQ